VTVGDEPVYEDETADAEPDPDADAEPEEYLGRASRRMIHLPLSTMKTSGTVIRGGPGGSAGGGRM